ncbi:MAG TPA: hypothetical protein VGR22_04545 [Thermomicrobiales bacterium]|nr:hypothetical protein [Thermomicrobiales bacterium]
MRSRLPAIVLAAFSLTLGVRAGPVVVSGQEGATPSASPEPVVVHPANIYTGTCEDLDESAYQLESVTTEPVEVEGTLGASPVPAETGLPGDVIGRSVSQVDASLQELLEGQYVVNVYNSENMETAIACGAIEGEIETESLSIVLHEVNDSGVVGQATFTDHGDGTAGVTVTLLDEEAELYATPQG